VARDVVWQGPTTGLEERVPEVEISGVNVPLSLASGFSDPPGGPLSMAEFFQGVHLGGELKVVDWMDGDDTAIDLTDEAHLE
jgi:hypothetical protein